MSFLAPFMAFGALAAGIPIALHFFYRSRYRTIPWAAMKFLLTSVEQTSRRLRFQELLLLLLRVALLILLAAALTRPLSSSISSSGKGDAVDALFIIDVSYSMAARDGSATRLNRAKAAALAIIDHLPPSSTVQVIRSADRASLVGPRSPSNLEQARQLIQSLQTDHLATDFLPAFSEALEALKRGHSPNKEIYLFSDMQKFGWDQQLPALRSKLQDASKQAGLYLVRCGARTPRNVAIVGIQPQSGIPHTGERIGFAVLVRNTGSEPVRDLTVSLEIDGQSRDRESRSLAVLAPGKTVPVTLTHGKLNRPGLRVLTASVQSDELEADNRYEQVVHVREQVRVLVVDGAPNEREPEKASSFFLLHGLRPVPEPMWGYYHIQPRVTTPERASPALLTDKDLCILVNTPVQRTGRHEIGALSPEFVERLAEFVREGHGLVIFGGDKVVPEAYNRVLLEEYGLLPARLAAAYSAARDQEPKADPSSADPHSFLATFREEPYERISAGRVMRALDVEKPAEENARQARVLLRYTNGKPAVVSGKVGNGEVVLFTTAPEPSWSDWPLLPTFVPLVHVTLGQLLSMQDQEHNGMAGEPLRWHPPAADATRPYLLVKPDGERGKLGLPQTVEERKLVTASDTARAGIYRIVPEMDTADEAEKKEAADDVFAVVTDLRESQSLESLTNDEIDTQFDIHPVHLTAGEDLSVFSGNERHRREWTVWLLLAVVGLGLGESVLAWFCDRAW